MLGYLYNVGFVADIVDGLVPGLRESCERNGENVVSKGLDMVISGMDAVGDAASSVRDGVGGLLHDSLSKVPLIGGVLGGITDAAGVVVDVGGGIYSEAMHVLGEVQDASNVVGAVTVGAKYVKSDAEAVDGLSDEQKEDMSAMEIIRSEGFTGGGISVIGKAVGGFFDHIMGTDEQAASPAWLDSLNEAYESGKISDQKAQGIVYAYEQGIVSDDVLNDYAASADAGECEWDVLGTNLCAFVASASQSGVAESSAGSLESALSEMEVAAKASCAEASAPSPSLFGPSVDSDGLVLD